MYIICMAKTLNVYIHDDNAENLKKEVNMSKLINDLLRDHFNKVDPKKMSYDELVKFIAIKKAEKEYKEKLEQIQNDRI